MGKKLYVGNISFDTDESGLRSHFAQYGEVTSATIVTDRDSGRSRGFGFVEMETEEMAEAAVAGMDGFEIDERRLRVNEAQPKEKTQRRSDFGERW